MLNLRIEKNGHVGIAAFGFEHAEDVACGAVAEKLAQSFFVIGDGVLLDQSNEIGGSVAG